MTSTSTSTTPAPAAAPKPNGPWWLNPEDHPLDHINDAARQIRGIAKVMQYALERDAKDGDGPAVKSFLDCCWAIASLSERIDESLTQLEEDEAKGVVAKERKAKDTRQ